MIIARLVSSQQQASKQQAASVHRPPRPKTRPYTIHHHSPTHPLTHTHTSRPPPSSSVPPPEKSPVRPRVCHHAPRKRPPGGARCSIYLLAREIERQDYFFSTFGQTPSRCHVGSLTGPRGNRVSAFQSLNRDGRLGPGIRAGGVVVSLSFPSPSFFIVVLELAGRFAPVPCFFTSLSSHHTTSLVCWRLHHPSPSHPHCLDSTPHHSPACPSVFFLTTD
jgi:hypothetical protein